MEFSVLVPPKKRKIINLLPIILSDEWPLSIRELQERLRLYNCSVTYQAIHRVLYYLLDKKVIIKYRKNNNKFCLNIDWIDNILEFSKNVKESYSKYDVKINSIFKTK